MKRVLLIISIMTFPLFGGFERIYGGLAVDKAFDIVQMSDGGFVICGSQDSTLAEFSDAIVLRVDAMGDTLWSEIIRTPLDEDFFSVDLTDDNNIILAGHANSPATEDYDIYLVKMSPSGELLWEKRIGISNEDDWGTKVRATSDGGYILTGFTSSFSAGDWDIYVIRTDSEGDTVWTTYAGGDFDDVGYDVRQTTDGGFVVTGITESDLSGIRDIFMLKLDAMGDTVWTHTYGGTGHDEAYGLELRDDGGYILVGSTQSFGSGGFDIYVISTDEFGDTLWTRTYGSSFMEWGSDIERTDDGGFIIAGWSSAYSGVGQQAYMLKIDSEGYMEWEHHYGGTSNDICNAVVPTSDGGFALAGYSFSYSAVVGDAYIVKTDSLGNVLEDEAWCPVCIGAGWNLLSWPFVENALFSEIYPHAIPPFFYYEGAVYEENDTIYPGKAFWMLSGCDTTVYRRGEEFSSSVDIELSRGWNMIGGPGDTVDVGIFSDYDEIVLPIFGYNPMTRAYDESDYLMPGRGYFILSTEESSISIGD